MPTPNPYTKLLSYIRLITVAAMLSILILAVVKIIRDWQEGVAGCWSVPPPQSPFPFPHLPPTLPPPPNTH